MQRCTSLVCTPCVSSRARSASSCSTSAAAKSSKRPLSASGAVAGEHEVVHGREEPQRHVPALVAPDDRADGTRIVGEVHGQPGIDRRAERLEVLRLPAEDVRETVSGRFRVVVRRERRLGLLRDRRERGRVDDGEVGKRLAVELDPALWTPFMNWLYESPFARAAALMRTIQSERKFRFLLRRSR